MNKDSKDLLNKSSPSFGTVQRSPSINKYTIGRQQENSVSIESS